MVNDSAELRVEHERLAEEDDALVARALSGDRVALEALVARYADDVFDTALGVVRDSDLAEDVAQDALVNALKGLAGFRGDASFRTWILRITVNTAMSARRRKTRRREVSLEVVGEATNEERPPDREALDRIESERVEAALSRLPEKQRLTVSLRLRQGLSYREIGEVTGSTEGSARVNYHLGIKRLKQWLA